MTRMSWVGLLGVLCVGVSSACGDDDSSDSGGRMGGVETDAGNGGGGDDYVCKDGATTLSYDFGLGDECNACATESCCDSFVDCQGETDCTCYWDCLNSGETECDQRCNITGFPPEFADHAVCLSDNCNAACGLDP